MVKMDMLRNHIKERRIPIEDLALSMGISASTLYRLIDSDGSKITIAQSLILKDKLSLSNAEYNLIFLPKDSQ